jgi:hypothetical protein
MQAKRENGFVAERADKRVATFDETIQWTFEGKVHEARRVVRPIERTADHHGQPLLFPALELEGWWTNLDKASCTPDALIALFQRRGTSKRYHSEFKTDLDLERLPSSKFDTNALVLALAALTYNILRYIGRDTLIGPDAPIRKAVYRRRPRTVLQEMIYKAARLVRHGRRYVLRFGRGDPGYLALARCYARVNV